MLAARLAQIRGAKQVIMIDNIEYRLKYVQEKVATQFSHQFSLPQACTLLAGKYSMLGSGSREA